MVTDFLFLPHFVNCVSQEILFCASMAHFRSLCNRSSLLRRRVNPSFSYILNDHDREESSVDGGLSQKGLGNVYQHRFFGNSSGNTTALGLYQGVRRTGFLLPSIIGSSSARYMSTAIGESSDKIELISDVAEVLAETPIEAVASQAAGVSEVAVAAADSFLPVAFLQHCIDAVHSFTGCNWFLSIAITTLIIRTATVPLLINQLKATTKLSLLRPELEQIQKDIRDKSAEPEAIYEGQKQMQKLFKEYGVTPFTPLKGIFIQGPVFVCFFLASNMQEGLEGNPIAGTMKTISRVFAVAAIPLTASFPTALFGYWLTSNFFSLLYGLALKVPGVKKSLGVPEITVPPAATTAAQAPFNLFSTPKQEVVEEVASVSSDESSSAKTSSRRGSSSSILSQRLRSLEKQVKERKKSKK
ncbi:unnamed protein product [Linum tenue]|uniref:Membrane insertase YidC/Oxa/ALB C-terminal domain-containing protein n=1 Tax=Linum tenue TaxID=586396 RepID=A0AAV0JFJ7_9ROSI|nr:unnamed protein product [Linum tenue]